MKLSILICSVQKRLTQFSALAEHLQKQANSKPVEILWLGDNKTMSVGEKRNKMVLLAKGDYICFVDDDDWVADDYVDEILQGITHKPDCVCFNAIYTKDGGAETLVDFSLKNILNVNEPGKPRIRVPNHLIPIKREFVLATKFLEKNFGEDTDYSLRVRKLLKTEYKIEKPLYHYRFSERGSETNKYAPKAPLYTANRGILEKKVSQVLPIGKDLGWAGSIIMDIVIVSNATICGVAMTQKCINSIAADNVNIIVLEKAERVKYSNADTFLQRQPFNYNQCLNDGALFGNAECICFSNNDVVFPDGFVERVMEEMNHQSRHCEERSLSADKAGNLSFEKDRDCRAPLAMTNSGFDVLSVHNQHSYMRPDIISGFCFVMRRSAWNNIGKLNTHYKFWCADNVTTEQIKQYGLKEKKSNIRVFHGTSVTLNKLDSTIREDYTKECVRQFNKDYGQNVMNLGVSNKG